MATFKPLVRKKRADGRYLVYIRCTHNRKVEYIKTDMYISEKEIKKGEISDFDVIGKCALRIKDFNLKLNREDIKNWTVSEVVAFITTDNSTISFSDFCQQFINKMLNEGRETTAHNYIYAKKSFEKHFGRNINFQDITSKVLLDWIKTLTDTARAKENYPKAIKAMFDAGCLEYNDYNRNIIRIQSRPFMGVKIPKHDLAKEMAVDAEIIKQICEIEVKTKRMKMSRDVAKLMVYLVGINSVDLFQLTHSNLKNNVLKYNRSKTKNSRPDKAYIEIKILPEIKPLFNEWKGESRLFDFGCKDARSFNRYVNEGLNLICDKLNIDRVSTYTFRHSWATIAQTKCGASTELVGFCLNHVSAHRITEGYIKKTFDPIDKLNKEVTDFIFAEKEDAQE